MGHHTDVGENPTHQRIVGQPHRIGQRHPCHNMQGWGAKAPSRGPPDLLARFNTTTSPHLSHLPPFPLDNSYGSSFVVVTGDLS